MPYFYRNDSTVGNGTINLLFIHIPKTGGTSLERYLSRYYHIPLNYFSLYSTGKRQPGDSSSPQHFTLNEIWSRRQEIRIHEENLSIITIVRHPYARMVSELFFNNWIFNHTTKEHVTKRIQKYLDNNQSTYDNHKLPQVQFVFDSRNTLWKGIEILRLESIEIDLARIGYNDFNYHTHSKTKYTHETWFNDESYQLINDYYRQDFTTFGYDMMHPVVNKTAITTVTDQSIVLMDRRFLLAKSHYVMHQMYNDDLTRLTLCFCILGLFICVCVVLLFRFKKY
jgi:hypothetical protein